MKYTVTVSRFGDFPAVAQFQSQTTGKKFNSLASARNHAFRKIKREAGKYAAKYGRECAKIESPTNWGEVAGNFPYCYSRAVISCKA